MDRSLYVESMSRILEDKKKFKIVTSDPTLLREGQLQRFLRKVKANSNLFTKEVYETIYPGGSQPARMYGLPKLHKVCNNMSPPFRPICSSIGTYNYKLAKFLCDLLTPCIPTQHCTKDSFSFVQEIQKVSKSNHFMVSFDVESLFTNIPLDETIELAVTYIFKHRPDLNVSRDELIKLFDFATKQTHFLFNNKLYDQIDGVAMGSPLGPALANLFMGHHESFWLKDENSSNVLLYRRYVDDIFCLFSNESHVEEFFDFINCQHPNIKFTVEKQVDNKLPFLDILIELSDNNAFSTSTYHKKTYTGLLLNYFSFTPSGYKIGLIKTLIDRAYKINQTWKGFDFDCKNIIMTLQRNSFPLTLVDKEMKSFVNSKFIQKNAEPDLRETRFFKLPFIGKYSSYTKSKLEKLIQKYCKEISVKLVFVTCKIGSNFSLKDCIPKSLKSNVVYKFSCAGCNTCYIGETKRHLETRIREHLVSDKNSHVYKHVHASEECFEKCDSRCFSILDSAPTEYQLKLKEAMHIEWERPSLNRQVKHLNLTITV